MDGDFPAEQDIAYVARVRRPDGRPFLHIAGVHAIGSRGAAHYLAQAANLELIQRAVGDAPFSMVVSCAFTRSPLRIVSSAALTPPRPHDVEVHA